MGSLVGSVVTEEVELPIAQPPWWHRYAACAGAGYSLFFPQRGASTRRARDICQHCRAREECLLYALVTNQKFGIWGGLTERERRRLRRDQE